MRRLNVNTLVRLRLFGAHGSPVPIMSLNVVIIVVWFDLTLACASHVQSALTHKATNVVVNGWQLDVCNGPGARGGSIGVHSVNILYERSDCDSRRLQYSRIPTLSFTPGCVVSSLLDGVVLILPTFKHVYNDNIWGFSDGFFNALVSYLVIRLKANDAACMLIDISRKNI